MSTNQLECEKEAIRQFATIIRSEKYLNGDVPVKLLKLRGILQRSTKNIEEHIRQHYSPQPVRKFLEAHPKVFFFYGSGKDTIVDVASDVTLSNYGYFLDAKISSRIQDDCQSTIESDVEEEAIIYFANIMRHIALKDTSCSTGVILKRDFNVILMDAPHRVKDYVSNEFKKGDLPTSLHQFIKRHHKIFPESFRGVSVRVKSNAEVLEYIAELFTFSDPEDSNSSTKSQNSTSAVLTLPIICDDKTVIIYFEAQFRDYINKYRRSWIKFDSLALFYSSAPYYITDYLKKYYGTCYLSKFLEKYRIIFPKSTCGLFFTILSNIQVQNYLIRTQFSPPQPHQHIQSSSSSSSNSPGPLSDAPKPINLQDYLSPTLKKKTIKTTNIGSSTLTSTNTVNQHIPTLTSSTNFEPSLFSTGTSQKTTDIEPTLFTNASTTLSTGTTLFTIGTNHVTPTVNNATNLGQALLSNTTVNQTTTSLNDPIRNYTPPVVGCSMPTTTTLASGHSLLPINPNQAIPQLNNSNFAHPLLPLSPFQTIPTLNNQSSNFTHPLLPLNPFQTTIPTLNNPSSNFTHPLLPLNPFQTTIPTLNNLSSNFTHPLLPLNPFQTIPTLNNASANFIHSLYANRMSNVGQFNLGTSTLPTNTANIGQSLPPKSTNQVTTVNKTNLEPTLTHQSSPTLNVDATKSTNFENSPLPHETNKAKVTNSKSSKDLFQILMDEISQQLDEKPTRSSSTEQQNDTKPSQTLKYIPGTLKFQTKPNFTYSSTELKSLKVKETFVEANYAYDESLQDLFSKTILTECDSNQELKPTTTNKDQEANCQTISSGEILSLKFFQE